MTYTPHHTFHKLVENTQTLSGLTETRFRDRRVKKMIKKGMFSLTTDHSLKVPSSHFCVFFLQAILAPQHSNQAQGTSLQSLCPHESERVEHAQP